MDSRPQQTPRHAVIPLQERTDAVPRNMSIIWFIRVFAHFKIYIFLQVSSLVASFIFKIEHFEFSSCLLYVTSRWRCDKAVMFEEKRPLLITFNSLNI